MFFFDPKTIQIFHSVFKIKKKKYIYIYIYILWKLSPVLRRLWAEILNLFVWWVKCILRREAREWCWLLLGNCGGLTQCMLLMTLVFSCQAGSLSFPVLILFLPISHVYLSPNFFQPPIPKSPSPYLPVLKWVSHHKRPFPYAGGSHSLFLKWHPWNLCQPSNSCSAGTFPQGIMSCLQQYLVVIGLDYALFKPFIIVRYS